MRQYRCSWYSPFLYTPVALQLLLQRALKVRLMYDTIAGGREAERRWKKRGLCLETCEPGM
jgi:hypothetical protein